jgi:hypothetical protein
MDRYVPELSTLVPEGWAVKSSITVLAPDGSANLITSSEPLGEEVTVEQYATIQGNILQNEFRRYREHSFVEAEVFGEHKGYLRHFSWVPAESEGQAVTQLQLYLVLNSRGYTATATAGTDDYLRVENTLIDIMSSVRIGISIQPPSPR